MAFQERHFDKNDKIQRLNYYQLYRDIIKNKHYKHLAEDDISEEEYKQLNYPLKVIKIMGDACSKNFPSISCKNQDHIDKIIFNSKLKTKLFQFASTTSALGDGYLIVEIKGKNKLIKNKEENKLIKSDSYTYTISSEKPENVEIVNDFNGDIAYYLIEGERHFEGKKYFYETKHEPNQITKKIYIYNEKNEKVLLQEPDVHIHNLDRFFIYHVPNMNIDGETYGTSDFEGVVSLIAEINNRASKIKKVQDYNSNPKVKADNKTIDNIMTRDKKSVKTDEHTGVKKIDMKKSRVIPVPDKDSVFENFTLEAKEEFQMKMLSFYINQFLTLTEIAPELLGSAFGEVNMPESGTALMFRLLTTEAKVRRLQNAIGHALEYLLYSAQLHDVEKSTHSDIKKAEKVTVTFPSFFPVDELTRAQVAVQELNKIKDVKTILIQNYGFNEDQANEIISRLKEDLKLDVSEIIDTSRYDKFKIPDET